LALSGDGPSCARAGALGPAILQPLKEDAIDLCDVLSSFSPQGKATLHEISRIMNLPGRPKGFDGGEVERYFHEGKIRRSPTAARLTWSILTGFGCGTSCFAVL
jgi:Predicted 3'-5' exonuclease related to the exonuclease domain of PolB